MEAPILISALLSCGYLDAELADQMSGELDALRAEHRAQDQEIARLRKVLE